MKQSIHEITTTSMKRASDDSCEFVDRLDDSPQRVPGLISRLVTVFLTLFVSISAAAQRPATYSNPVIAGDFPDPSVIRNGQDYWATATSGGWAPHFLILHSSDLVNWKQAGAVFTKAPTWAKGDFWAPEISEDGGRFYVYYTARRNDGPGKKGTLCVAVATAGTPAGPYADHGPLVCQDIGSIDAMTLRDEKNQRYLIWKEDGNDRNQPTPIWAQPLSEDGLKLTGKRKEILRNDASWERHVTEGSFILKRGEWFYHFYSGNACCGRGCNYALGVARSRKLLGPWQKSPANPILSANSAWQCPGHGSIVSTPDGRTFMLYHSYRRRADTFNIGRESLLDEIKWDADGWPVINDGHGPSSVAVSPLGVEQHKRTGFLDEFQSPGIDGWQWPMEGRQSAREEGGFLRLEVEEGRTVDDWTAALLARPTTSGDYEATTAVDISGTAERAHAGLAAFSRRKSAIGIAVGKGKVYVWRREGARQEVLATKVLPAARVIYLRMRVSGGEKYLFDFSPDGKNWLSLNDAVNGSYVEGARVALTVGGPLHSFARFDWLRIDGNQTGLSMLTREIKRRRKL